MYSKIEFMPSLSTKWSKQPQPGIAEKINDTIKPKGALKPRVNEGIKKITITN